MSSKTLSLSLQPSKFLLALSSLVLSLAVSADELSAIAQLGNGVIVDPAGQLAFAMHPKAGIQAVSLETGETLWKNAAVDLPVTVSGASLLTQVQATEAGVLSLTYLDKTTGDTLNSVSLALPDNTWARVGDSLETKFSLRAVADGAPESLHWTHSFKLAQGAQLSRKETPAQKTEGFLTADFSKRTVAAASKPSNFKEPAVRRAAIPANAPGRRALYSLDQNHIATSTALSAEERHASSAGERYQWHVFTADGQKLGSFNSAVSFAPFVVVEDKLLYVGGPRKQRVGDRVTSEPASLLAVNLTNGEQAFKVAIKDTKYRGPFPP